MKDKLILINKYKDLIEIYSDYSLIYPRKYLKFKDMLESLLFDNLKEMYIINSISNKNIKFSRKEELLGKLKYLNYLFERLNKLNILTDKQYKVLYLKLEEIYKYLVGWVRIDK